MISTKEMNEVERNTELFLLLQKLLEDKNYKAIELLGTMVINDTISMQKSYSIIIKSNNDEVDKNK